MGWASGTTVMSEIISIIQEEIDDFEVRKRLYERIAESLQDQDWDCVEECLGEDEAFDAWYNEKYGED